MKFHVICRTQRYEILKNLFEGMKAKSSSLQEHALKIIEWIKWLVVLEVELVEMSIDLILQSLLDYFSQFIINFNMNKI